MCKGVAWEFGKDELGFQKEANIIFSLARVFIGDIK